MQLLRNNCHIRANVFVILVAANGRVKEKPKRRVWPPYFGGRMAPEWQR